MPNMPTRLSMFSKPRDVYIENFLVADEMKNVKNTKPQAPEDRLRGLYSAVASNAILNAGGRGDEVRCHPGTRARVIDMIETWMDGNDESPLARKRIMWLSGPAGAGKSAIMQTIAERQKARGGPAANFFFFRGDDTRNHANHIVATLLYQLFDFYPALKGAVAAVLLDKPLILQESIQDQFAKLISSPMDTITRRHAFPRHQSIPLLVDGLDECSSNDKFKKQQQQVLLALQTLVTRPDSPFNVLLASRREPHLIRTFNTMETLTRYILLNDDYRPDDDIHHFVTAKFCEIKATHHLARHLEEQWPPEDAINDIVTKSSGQFIYAATVMRFLESSSASPGIMLKIVRGLKPAEGHSPFGQLDAMYSYILSQATNKPEIKMILGIHFLIGLDTTATRIDQRQFERVLRYYNGEYTASTVESHISDLSAILRLGTGQGSMRLVFYHASLGDYLTDQSRSGVHCVDLDVTCTHLCVALLRQQPRSLHMFFIGVQAMDDVIRHKSPSPHAYRRHAMRINQSIMTTIFEKYFVHDRDKYEKMLRRWICLGYYYHSPIHLESTAYPLYKEYTRRIALELLWLKICCRLLRHPVGARGPCAICMSRYFKLNESIS